MCSPLVSVVTANSNSGKSCIKELFDKYAGKVRVRGVFRSEEKSIPFRSEFPKLEVVTGVDASQVDTLDKAFRKADYALIVTPHDPTKGMNDDANLTANMINSAVKNGVKYIVLVASFTVHYPDQIKLISSRFLPSEKLLEKLGKEKGLKWTVLRGGFFMENTIPMFKDSIKQNSTINFPDAHLATVDTRDIGKSAAACFASGKIDQHNGKYYEMNGPEVLNGEKFAAVFSKVLGREIKSNRLPREMLRKVMPEPLAELFEAMVDIGKSATPFTDDVKRLTGQNSSFEEFIRAHKSEFE